MDINIEKILEEVNDIQVRYSKPLLERNYTDSDYATVRYDKLVCKMINIIINLQKENEILKENAIHNDKVVDKVNWENRLLKDKIDKLEKDIQKEIDRTNKLIEEDIGLFEINNIRKALNETRQYILLRLRQLRGKDNE